MKKILFSIFSAFMVSTMASAQYVNVKMDDGTYASYKTSSKTEVDFGKKKGAELTPSGYYSKAEVDSMLQKLVDYYQLESLTIGLTDEKGEHDYGLIDKSREINYLLWGRRAMDSVEADVIWETVPDKGSILERLDNHQRYLKEISELLTGHREGLDILGIYMADFPYGVLEYLKSGVRSKAKTASIPANAETASPDEILEENKFLKNKIAELEKRLEALEAK